jgi:hypothetical protein
MTHYLKGLILAGCCLTAACASSWQQFSTGLQRYPGYNVSLMIDRFGAPDKTLDLPADSVRAAYTWKIRDRSGAYRCDVTAIVAKTVAEVEKVTDSCRLTH